MIRSSLRVFATLRLCVKIILLLPALSVLASDFDSANRLYEKSEYAAAIAAYERLTSNGVSAPLLFNLGNAYFKNGQTGKAIAAYRRAQQLDPRDPDIRANLHFARGSVPGNNLRLSALDRFLALASLNELGVFVTIALWSLFGLLAAAQFQPRLKTSLRPLILVVALFTLVSSAWLIHALLQRSANRIAVVTIPNGAVRFGPLEESQVSFNVRDGNELRILSKKDNWLQVADASNRSGWIPLADVIQLR